MNGSDGSSFGMMHQDCGGNADTGQIDKVELRKAKHQVGRGTGSNEKRPLIGLKIGARPKLSGEIDNEYESCSHEMLNQEEDDSSD